MSTWEDNISAEMLEWLERRRAQRVLPMQVDTRMRLAIDAELPLLHASLTEPAVDAQHSLERPWSVRQALEQNVPQAILRDLYRPESSFPLSMEVQDLAADPAGAPGQGESRAAMGVRYTVNTAAISLGWEQSQKARRALAKTLAQPWEDWDQARDRGRDGHRS